jgi:hypothetical protein
MKKGTLLWPRVNKDSTTDISNHFSELLNLPPLDEILKLPDEEATRLLNQMSTALTRLFENTNKNLPRLCSIAGLDQNTRQGAFWTYDGLINGVVGLPLT